MQTFTVPAGVTSLTLDVQRFEKGLYLIQGVKDGSILFQDKFIKQ